MVPRDISHLNNLRPPLLTRRMEATRDIFHLKISDIFLPNLVPRAFPSKNGWGRGTRLLLTRWMKEPRNIFHLNNLRPPLLTRRIEAPRGMKVIIRVVVTASSIQTVLLCYMQIMCAIDALRRGSAAHTIYEFYKGRRCSSEITYIKTKNRNEHCSTRKRNVSLFCLVGNHL